MTQEQFIQELENLKKLAPLVDGDKDIEDFDWRKDYNQTKENYTNPNSKQSNREEAKIRLQAKKEADLALENLKKEIEDLQSELKKAIEAEETIMNDVTLEKASLNSQKLQLQRSILLNPNLSQIDKDKITQKLEETDESLKEAAEKEQQAKKNVQNITKQLIDKNALLPKYEKEAQISADRVNYLTQLAETEKLNGLVTTDVNLQLRMYDEAELENERRDLNKRFKSEFSQKRFTQAIDYLVNGLKTGTIAPELAQSYLNQYVQTRLNIYSKEAMEDKRLQTLVEIQTKIAGKNREIALLENRLKNDAFFENPQVVESYKSNAEKASVEYNKAIKRANDERQEWIKIDNEINDLKNQNSRSLDEISQIEIDIKNSNDIINNPNLSENYKNQKRAAIKAEKDQIDLLKQEIEENNKRIQERIEAKKVKAAEIQRLEQQALLAQKYINEYQKAMQSSVDKVVRKNAERKLQDLKYELLVLKDQEKAYSVSFINELYKVIGTTIEPTITQQQAAAQQAAQQAGQQAGQQVANTQTAGAQANNQSTQAPAPGNTQPAPSALDKLSNYRMDGSALDRLENEGVYLSSSVKKAAEEVEQQNKKATLSERYLKLKEWLKNHSPLITKNKDRQQDPNLQVQVATR